MSSHRICFVAPLARPIVEPGFRCDFGGAEVRAVHFASGLADDARFQVSMVLRSYRHEPPQRIGQLTAYFETADAPISRTRELPLDALFFPRLIHTKLQKLGRSIQKLRNANGTEELQPQRLVADVPADIIGCFGVNQYSARIVRAARQAGKRTLLFLAHDQDLEVERYRTIVEAYGGDLDSYRQMVETVDHIVCQTPRQLQRLQNHFGRHGDLIRNPIDLRDPITPRTPQGEYILWVGRADRFFKRADKMLELAAKCPEIPFVAIMNPRKPKIFEELVGQAPSNVCIVKHVPFHEIETYYANATALLSTSIGEGFPNAFLQAGKYGRPILSLDVDPGEMLSQYGCGECTQGNLDAMVDRLKTMWDQREGTYRKNFAHNIRRYVETYHDLPGRVQELGQVVMAMSPGTSQQQAA